MSYLEIDDESFGFFDLEKTRERGSELCQKYKNAAPFPHIYLDGFLPPSVVKSCLETFPQKPDPDSQTFDRDQERFKSSFHPDYLSGFARSLFYSFNSRPFIAFLENLTGIEGLIPDPYFVGAGYHQIETGGHLSVHADFNHHKKLNLERRINVLIYLNEDWKPEYGGSLELWDEGMKECVVSINPAFNRCVVFNTTSTSFHGNPGVVNHPENLPRRSIALYYYTATWSDAKKAHTTHFRRRSGTEDSFDRAVWLAELADDFIPPVVVRNFRRLKRRLKSA